MHGNEIYDLIIKQYANIFSLNEVVGLLHWDQRVMMPQKGLNQRAEATALIDKIAHGMLTNLDFVSKVNELAGAMDDFDSDQKVCIREIKRQVDLATKVSSDLVEKISRHVSLSNAAWVKARENSDFSHFAPFLEKMVELRKEEAEALGYKDNPYDAMIDRFEPYADEASISKVFEDLRERLVPFVQNILSKPKKSDGLIHGPKFDIEKQRQFGLGIIRDFGFDFEGGRQDVSVHPFCVGTMGDVRITTRFYDDDLRPAVFGMFHEAGHGMYEQGFKSKYSGTPLAEHISLAIHESQSRLWENLVGRSMAFWKHYYPALQSTFPEALGQAGLEEFYEAINIIEGSLIRVEADEATYQLHIILRFEIESDLINGRIDVGDLPDEWNRRMEQYLGVKVPNDAEGVLQDVHWSEGLFGYFPTYCLGNLYSAQFFAKASEDIPDLDLLMEKGDFKPLLTWLRENIHCHGKRYPALELVKRVTGKPLSPESFMDYLEKKFGPLYGM